MDQHLDFLFFFTGHRARLGGQAEVCQSSPASPEITSILHQAVSKFLAAERFFI